MSGYLGTKAVLLSTTTATVGGDSTVGGDLTVDTNTLFVDSTNNRVGVGTASPSNPFQVGTSDLIVDSSGNLLVGNSTAPSAASANAPALLVSGPNDATIQLSRENATAGGGAIQSAAGAGLVFYTHTGAVGSESYSERLRLTAAGDLLVGKTSVDNTTAGGDIYAGSISLVEDGSRVATFVRKTSDGEIVSFRKDTTTVGSIGNDGGDTITIGSGDVALAFQAGADAVIPWNTSGSVRDNAIDLGRSIARFDDIYATNGTIQTSDQNEKQQIAALTDAEMTAAKAISKLFKTFKWNDSVAEKGDAARTHTGVIAQEVEQAMTDAGLNAGDYAFFISSDWTDEETGEERNRKGIRYPQLMSFIGAATEQRLASIETRLDALEAE